MNQNLIVPGAIVVAGLVIAGSIFFTSGSNPAAVGQHGGDEQDESAQIAEVTENDYIRGSIDAPIKVVEYSDLDCPFCKRFHVTMATIVDEFPGDVAWVYRHFPLDSLHPNAPTLAQGAECAGELGGNDGFWNFIDEMFVQAPEGKFFSPDDLGSLATSVGLDGAALTQCVESGKYEEKVQSQFDEAVAAGGRGTPFNVIIVPDGSQLPLEGAQPVEQMRTIVETLLEIDAEMQGESADEPAEE